MAIATSTAARRRLRTAAGTPAAVSPGTEVAVLVEHAVVGQVVLGRGDQHPAAVQQRRRVLRALRTAGRCRGGGPVWRPRYPVTTATSPSPSAASRDAGGGQRRDRRVDERGAQGEVFHRVPGEHHLGEDDQAGAAVRGAAGPFHDRRRVARQVTHGGVDLGKSDPERGHVSPYAERRRHLAPMPPHGRDARWRCAAAPPGAVSCRAAPLALPGGSASCAQAEHVTRRKQAGGRLGKTRGLTAGYRVPAAATPAEPVRMRRHGQTGRVRARTLEERDIRFVRLWFTDVLGFLKSVAVAPAELGGRVRGGHRLRRVGGRGVRPRLRGRHDRCAGPVHVPAAAAGAASTRGRAGCSATS